MARKSFRHFLEHNQGKGKFSCFLVYAPLEWTLIILLFIDALTAFISNQFAKFFELKTPCLICSRIDHLIVNKSPNFYYNDSICEAHKKDVSSLAYCHTHKKLGDIQKMCDACLLPFSTEKEMDCNTNKSVGGILHKDLDCLVEDNQQRCLCCGEPLKARSSYSGKISRFTSPTPAPSPRFLRMRNEESRNLESHIRYTEVKLLSDNELEIQDNEYSQPLNQFKEDAKFVKAPLPRGVEDHIEDRTPTFGRGNRFFGIPLDSTTASPRFARLARKSPLDKTETNSEIGDTNVSNDLDIDSILNEQLPTDRKSLIALYMELDEERNASAVAANNAMAMITWLQEEKAAFQMEALQYQRMMEEQAEYDGEILQEANTLLAERKEEITVLNAELEAYRQKYGYLEDYYFKRCNEEADDYQEFSTSPYSEVSENAPNEEDDNYQVHVNNSDQAVAEDNQREVTDTSAENLAAPS